MPSWLDELHLGAGPPWHAMGTRTLDVADWLIADDDGESQLALKRSLLRDHRDDVVAMVDGSDAAVAEAAALVAGASSRGAPLGVDGSASPLETAALLVQEDLCVLRRRDHDGRWCLDAGVVCFPSMWSIRNKLGLPLADVHGPVPAYAEELAERVDRFVDHLRADRPVWRRNWLIHDSPELHLPAAPTPSPRPLSVPDDLWLRSERQTLRLLPKTGAVLFTIRTQQAPFAVLARRPDIAAGIATALRAWSPALVAYRGAGRWRTDALTWLELLAGAS